MHLHDLQTQLIEYTVEGEGARFSEADSTKVYVWLLSYSKV